MAEHVAGDPFGQVGHAVRFGAVAPEPLVEQERVEPFEPVVKPARPVGVPEEAGIAQPCHEHALGVARNAGDVVARGVGHRQEVRQQPAAGVDHREVVLVVHHRGRQHFVRELEELLRKAPGHHRRMLDQVGHLAGQRRLCLDGRDRAAGLAGAGGELARDAGAPLRAIDQHVGACETLPVVGERRHLDRLPGLALPGEEAVPVADAARADRRYARRLRRCRATDDEWHDPAAVEEDQPADRPPEEEFLAPVVERGVPAHRLREREIRQHRGQHAAEHDRVVRPRCCRR